MLCSVGLMPLRKPARTIGRQAPASMMAANSKRTSGSIGCIGFDVVIAMARSTLESLTSIILLATSIWGFKAGERGREGGGREREEREKGEG